MSKLRLILGDQLNSQISSLSDADKASDVILMCEVWEETTYVQHHKKKIAFILSAMRHFAQELRDSGYNVHYIELNDPANTGSFTGEVKRAVEQFNPEKIIVTEPAEYRVLKMMRNWQFDVPINIRRDDRFLCTHAEFEQWADGRKQFRMEYFYREMRKKYNILMQGDDPEGGQWNYDSENRKPPKEGLDVPPHYISKPDDMTRQVIALVGEKFPDHFGDLTPFHFAVTRQEALIALEQFVQKRLAQFGDYQDAMVQGEPWMFHAHISFYINCGLLLPLECVLIAQRAYEDGLAPLNAVEGFIRQIIGWREYVRGIYWLKMPDYARRHR